MTTTTIPSDIIQQMNLIFDLRTQIRNLEKLKQKAQASLNSLAEKNTGLSPEDPEYQEFEKQRAVAEEQIHQLDIQKTNYESQIASANNFIQMLQSDLKMARHLEYSRPE